MTDVKICGLKTPEAVTAAIESGARFLGFNFIPASPRYAQPELAAYLTGFVPPDVYKVGLFENPDDATLKDILSAVPLDMLQLHGAESPGRVAEVKHLTGLPVIKAVHIGREADFDFVQGYEAAADWLLFDAAKGGSGAPADWKLLHQYCTDNPPQKPWMLAGGLDAGNIQEALSLLDPDAVDVSSGVESARGVKDPGKITAFLSTVHSLSS